RPGITKTVTERELNRRSGCPQQDADLIGEPGQQAPHRVGRQLIEVYGHDAPGALDTHLHHERAERQDDEGIAKGPSRHDQEREPESDEYRISTSDSFREHSTQHRTYYRANVVEHCDVGDSVGRDSMLMLQEIWVQILRSMGEAGHEKYQGDHVEHQSLVL